MRYDTEHKQKTRERVLKVAAKAIRAHGPHRIGVAGVMAKAGLTHGGFYAHFESKEELVAAAIGQMFEEAQLRFTKETQNKTPAKALESYIDFYLSTLHRDALASGCPIPALAGELPRLKQPARQSFTAGVQRLTKLFADLIARLHVAHPQDVAMSMVSEMVGALSLARAEPDAERSQRILDVSRRVLKSRVGLKVPS